MIRKFGSRRASTAARMRLIAVSASTTSLPSRWPQRFGLTWSSMWRPATPASSSSCTVRATFIGSPKPVSASTSDGQVGHPGDLPRAGGHLGEGGQADVGQAEVGGEHGAGDVDAVEALVLDQPGRERVERAREAAAARRWRELAAERRALLRGGWLWSRASEQPLRRCRRLRSISAGCCDGCQAAELVGVELGQALREVEEPLDLGSGRARRRPGCGTCRRTARGRTAGRPSGWASATAISSMTRCRR